MADPIILHIAAMLDIFDHEALTAVYMVVRQMYDMKTHFKNRVS